jgi:hypothetical protein
MMRNVSRKNSAPKAVATRTALVASLYVACTFAAFAVTPSTRSVAALTERESQQPATLADAVTVARPTLVRIASGAHKAKRWSGKTWLNPQPEPPMAASKKKVGGTWLNPQPEPPRPVANTNKLR